MIIMLTIIKMVAIMTIVITMYMYDNDDHDDVYNKQSLL